LYVGTGIFNIVVGGGRDLATDLEGNLNLKSYPLCGHLCKWSYLQCIIF